MRNGRIACANSQCRSHTIATYFNRISDMRLTPLQQRIIKEEVARVMGEGVRVLLFGSRTDDSRRGGDIDLYLETPTRQEQAWRKVLRLNAALQERLGEQKLDIVLHQPDEPLQAIHIEAKKQGIRL